jgi:hypothetical protein
LEHFPNGRSKTRQLQRDGKEEFERNEVIENANMSRIRSICFILNDEFKVMSITF